MLSKAAMAVLRPGRNCDPLVKANRFALLVDGADYYAAVADSIRRARRTVAMVGWDLDSRTRLGPGVATDGRGPFPQLRDFLVAAVEAAPLLHIYVLSWDFPLLFANVRDPKLVLRQDPFQHPRIHFRFDNTHPAGASHHQKIVVIDDCLAFTGGMDIAGGRWDTSEHRPDDPRRAGKNRPYAPTHDVQAMVDGEAARALAAIVRERWLRSTGTAIPEHSPEGGVWPESVTPDLEGARVGISRTDVDANGAVLRCEVEHLHFDLIEAARHAIYIENQYLTGSKIVAALCRRLQEEDGPEIIILLPLKSSGWLEEYTIQRLRCRSMRQLREADRFGRLRICYPVVPGLNGEAVQVHSKILVVDDRLFRVGSANLTNRSMRLDTECDVTIEATSAPERKAVATLRNRLLAEHLGLSVAAVSDSLAENPSLVRLVDSRRTTARCLREIELDADDGELLVGDELIDPAEPITPIVVAGSLWSPTVLKKWLIPATLAAAAVAFVFRARLRRSSQ